MAMIAALGERLRIGKRDVVLTNSYNVINVLSSYCPISYSIILDNITIASQTNNNIVDPLTCRLFFQDWSAIFTTNQGG